MIIAVMIICDDHSLLDLKSAVQCMKYFIYHFTLINDLFASKCKQMKGFIFKETLVPYWWRNKTRKFGYQASLKTMINN